MATVCSAVETFNNLRYQVITSRSLYKKLHLLQGPRVAASISPGLCPELVYFDHICLASDVREFPKTQVGMGVITNLAKNGQ